MTFNSFFRVQTSTPYVDVVVPIKLAIKVLSSPKEKFVSIKS